MRERLFPLVFVVGTDDSGAALVERLVAAHPSTWDLGEGDALPRELAANADCACGSPLASCPFWGPLSAELPVDALADTAFAEHETRPIVRWRHVYDLVRGTASPEHIARAKEYGELQRRLLETVRAAAERAKGGEVRWIVDGSRDPYRLLWLKDSRRFDLRVIHVVRDPRSFVWSELSAQETSSKLAATRFASKWMVANGLVQRLLNKGFRPEHVLRVRFEDLIAAPEETLDGVGAFLGLRYPNWATRAALELPSHSIGSAREVPGIDESWRDRLAEPLAQTAWRVTSPLRGCLGYAQR